MGFKPPKGVRPPQLEGKRTGRPKGSKNFAEIWQDVRWAFEHRDHDRVWPPSKGALVWWYFAQLFPCELEDFLMEYGRI